MQICIVDLIKNNANKEKNIVIQLDETPFGFAIDWPSVVDNSRSDILDKHNRYSWKIKWVKFIFKNIYKIEQIHFKNSTAIKKHHLFDHDDNSSTFSHEIKQN